MKSLTDDWTSLAAAVQQRQQEVQQHQQRIVQITEDIQRNSGAMAYNKILADKVRGQLEALEKVAAVVAAAVV